MRKKYPVPGGWVKPERRAAALRGTDRNPGKGKSRCNVKPPPCYWVVWDKGKCNYRFEPIPDCIP